MLEQAKQKAQMFHREVSANQKKKLFKNLRIK